MLFLYLLTFLALANLMSADARSSSSFVTVSGATFQLGGKPFYFAGANCYDIFTYGSSSGDTETSFMNKTKIDEQFKTMAANGVTVVRTWAFNTQNNGWHSFEPTKGAYSQQELELFDYIVVSADTHGIKLIVTLENYWNDFGGVAQRLAWEGVALNPSYPSLPNQGVFFVNEAATQSYLNYVEHFISRTNHYTNISYINTTTIFAWELMNEPRYQGYGDDETSTVLRAWVDKVGARIKGLDPNHLLGAGLEGHGSKYMGGNEGNDFLVVHASPYLDYCTAHPYPTEQWYNFSIPQMQEIIARWTHDAQVTLGKPMVIEEFNVYKENWSGSRSDWWTGIFQAVENLNAAGSLFWWFQSNSDPNNGYIDTTYGVSAGDEELEIFKAHSENMKNKNI